MRKIRKQEHIENFLKCSQDADSLMDDVFIYHQASSSLSHDEVDTSTKFLNKEISFPFLINAITGGTSFANDINRDLAQISKDLNVAMAVGSQTIALEDKQAAESFEIVRKTNPDGLIIGNLSALSPVENVLAAIEMIQADAIQVHLNIGQELVMEEGDRDFSKLLDNIQAIIEASPVPVIVKEVGQGLSADDINRLYDRGARIVDIAGLGGCSFIEIENLRNSIMDFSDLYSWGNPTALALIEAVALKKKDLTIISSGGLRTATDIAKSLIIGAHMTAMSSEVLNYLVRGDINMARDFVQSLRDKLRLIMVMSGAKTIKDLQSKEYKVSGRLKDLLD